jgi:hypothetical protein
MTLRLAASVLASQSHRLAFHRGQDVTLDFQLSPPEDSTGWTVALKIAPALAGSVELTKSATVTDGPRGRFRVTLAAADTASLAVGRHVWDARRTDSGHKTTLADGVLDLLQEVTT